MKDTAKALTEATAEIELNPNDAEAYAIRAAIYDEMEHFEAALSDLSHAINLNKGSSKFVFFRATVYYHMKKFDAALSDINLVISQDDSNSDYYELRGMINNEMQYHEAAITDFSHAINKDPSFINYSIRANLFENTGQLGLARADFEKALELNPDDIATLEALARFGGKAAKETVKLAPKIELQGCWSLFAKKKRKPS